MKAHEVNYQVFGDDLQFVEIELDPGETVIAEAGVMMYMEDGIGFESKMGDGSAPKAGFWDHALSPKIRVLPPQGQRLRTRVYHGRLLSRIRRLSPKTRRPLPRTRRS